MPHDKDVSPTPLNRQPKYMSGEYAKMFDLAVHDSNRTFANNPYKPNTCRCGDQVCFSLTKGALPCRPDDNSMLVWNATGNIMSIPINEDNEHPGDKIKNQKKN